MFCFVFLPQVEIEAPVLEDQKQDGHQPGQPEIADTAIPPPAEKPEADPLGAADERNHHTNGLPDAPGSVEGGGEAITSQQDGEKREEESVEVVVSYLKEFIPTVLFVHLSSFLLTNTITCY